MAASVLNPHKLPPNEELYRIDEGVPAPLPRRLFYSISARIGGKGLDQVAEEALQASQQGGFLAKAIAYDQRSQRVDPSKVESLRWHPVRLLSFLDSQRYYGAKKHYLDWWAARRLADGRGDYDLVHSWSGESLATIREAHRQGIPAIIDIPTWHRDKFKKLKAVTDKERRLAAQPWPRRVMDSLYISRARMLAEYAEADLLITQSRMAAETFLFQGVDPAKLVVLGRAVDASRFKVGTPPEIFRVLFAGALVKRKGIHTLLEAWAKLNLKDAELWLAGTVHDEAKPFLERFARDNVKVLGFTPKVEELFAQSSLFVLPSELEGSAKVSYEAGAVGLPQITTAAAGDFVVDGYNGRLIEPNDVGQLAEALQQLHADPDLRARMGQASRQRVLEHFTWEHFRKRLLQVYARAMKTP